MSGREPRVEFLWWAGCPSWERALAMLREAMTEAGLDPEAIEIHEIETEADAERHRFPGSPTIRFDGEDVQPLRSNPPLGLTCRVYRRGDGSASPLPETAELREALARATDQRSK